MPHRASEISRPFAAGTIGVVGAEARREARWFTPVRDPFFDQRESLPT
jgi:hypothetical protein